MDGRKHLSMFLRLHEPLASDLPIGDIKTNAKVVILELFTICFSTWKAGDSGRIDWRATLQRASLWLMMAIDHI